MRYFHRTTRSAAKTILKRGFKDATGYYLTTHLHKGVWISDGPLDVNEGAEGDALLAVIVDERRVARYEWKEEGKGYREFLVPARILNQYAKITEVTEEEEEGQYDTGQVVPEDYVQYHARFSLLAKEGFENARKARDELAKRMTPAQIDEAQRLTRPQFTGKNVEEWKPKQ